MNSSCPLPRSDQFPYFHGIQGPHKSRELAPSDTAIRASLVNCSRALMENQVACLSTNYSFVYLMFEDVYVGNLEPSCGYLAVFLLGGRETYYDTDTYYPDFSSYLRGGFSVQFPQTETALNYFRYINRCIDWSIR